MGVVGRIGDAVDAELDRLRDRLLGDRERRKDQDRRAAVTLDRVGPDQLLQRLAQAGTLEQRSATATQRPPHDVTLEGLERRVDVTRIDIEARERRQLDLGGEEVGVARHAAPMTSRPMPWAPATRRIKSPAVQGSPSTTN